MPIQVQRYLCNVCQREHPDYAAAFSCETIPQAEQFHKVGEEAPFESESQLGQSRYSYCTMRGKILYAYLDYCEFEGGERMHCWSYVVEVTDRYGTAEYHVRGGKVWGLFSPTGSRYNSGFAAAVQAARENPG